MISILHITVFFLGTAPTTKVISLQKLLDNDVTKG